MLYRYNKKELKFEKAIDINSLKWVVLGFALMSFISINTMEVNEYEI